MNVVPATNIKYATITPAIAVQMFLQHTKSSKLTKVDVFDSFCLLHCALKQFQGRILAARRS